MIGIFKKSLALLLLATSFMQFTVVSAADNNFNASVPNQGIFDVYEIVNITGQGFDKVKESGFVCFNSFDICFDSDDQLIQQWTDNLISFKMPYANNVTQSGQAFVVGQGEIIAQFPYSFRPFVEGFVQNGKLVTEVSSSQVLQLQGTYFGNKKGTVKFGIVQGDVTSWSDDLINVTVPSLTNTDTKFVEICSEANLCSTEDFTVRKLLFNDTMSSLQSYLNTIKYNKAYSLLTPKDSIVVAVVDDGIDAGHPELKEHIWVNEDEVPNDNKDNDNNNYIDDYNGYNFLDRDGDLTPSGTHGTSVAGVISASRNNEIGITGIAPNAEIMSLIICGEDDMCDEEAISKSIRYAVDNGARIINLSLAATSAEGYSSKFNDVIRYAYEKNVLVVVAAGNGYVDSKLGRDLTENPESPICNDNDENMVLGVAASDSTNTKKASWSNYGNCVDIFAPGEDIMALSTEGKLYEEVAGTSFATPIVSGVAAQILSTYPNMKNSTLINYFVKNGPYLDTEKLFNDINATYKDEDVVDNGETGVPESSVVLASGFSDVKAGNKNLNAIVYLKQNNVIAGFPDGTFRPDQAVTRAEMLKILIIGGLGITPDDKYKQNCFSDVKVTDWYAPYVCYAKTKGWAEGYPDGTFRPNQTINKVEAVKFLAVINDLENVAVPFLPYSDVDENAWYGIYLKQAFGLGLLEETDNIYQPNAVMTRGSISESIFRLLLVKKFSAESYSAELLKKL